MERDVIEVQTGSHGEDGILELSLFTADMITIAMKRSTERTHTLLLNKVEALALRDALDVLIPQLEPK